uniref:Uncharacterized protein n=1 Tax=Cacopsylla melanoneura TaxID=428564 RepID=A0A8D9DWR4_9HEMI
MSRFIRLSHEQMKPRSTSSNPGTSFTMTLAVLPNFPYVTDVWNGISNQRLFSLATNGTTGSLAWWVPIGPISFLSCPRSNIIYRKIQRTRSSNATIDRLLGNISRTETMSLDRSERGTKRNNPSTPLCPR